MSRAGPPSAALAAAAAIVFLALGALLGLAAGRSSGITVGDVAVQIELDRDAFSGGADPIESWIRRSASIVAGYYGHFPVARLTVRVMAERGDGVHGGKSFANPEAYIQVRLGQDVTEAQLLSDWVLVHEMAHLALPDAGEAHAWLCEGLATYVEAVARGRHDDTRGSLCAAEGLTRHARPHGAVAGARYRVRRLVGASLRQRAAGGRAARHHAGALERARRPSREPTPALASAATIRHIEN